MLVMKMTRAKLNKRRRGVALIFTLLVLAVLITLVATLSTATKIDIVQAENVQHDEQNKILLDSAIRMVKYTLLADMQNSKHDSLHESWCTPVELEFGDSVISWSIEDEGGKLNVNLLAFGTERQRKDMEDALARLVGLVAKENNIRLRTSRAGSPIVILGEETHHVAVQGIIDFLSVKAQEAAAAGAVVIEENKIRVTRPILFRVDELIEADGMTAELLYGKEGKKGLAEYLTVWSDDRVNINTAPKNVLMALSESMDEKQAKAFEEYRLSADFTDIEEDLASIEDLDQGMLNELEKMTSVRSRFFVAHCSAKTGGLQRNAMIVFRRPDLRKVIAEEAVPTVDVVYYKSQSGV